MSFIYLIIFNCICQKEKESITYRLKIPSFYDIITKSRLSGLGVTASFDVIVCHNVLEYMDPRTELLREFHRLLKPGSALSIVKHNKFGKIMQKVVFEYNTKEAKALLRGENIESANFGEINEYSTEDLIRCCENLFTLEAILGVRLALELGIKFSKKEILSLVK